MVETDPKIIQLQSEIKKLPKGNITYKTIRGAKRMYINGRYVKAADELKIMSLVEKRNKLESELHSLLTENIAHTSNSRENKTVFLTNVICGTKLNTYIAGVKKYKKRECYKTLSSFLESDIIGKVCLLYGLRRTGKTVMLFQAIADHLPEHSAYIKIMASNTMADLNNDLRILMDQGFRYIFIDEITLMSDFIDSASLLSDVYAMGGMKIVLSGTDSLGFVFSADEELYDRTISIHTTFIPFREYSSLLGIHDIDEYIRYGGTFMVGETDFDNPDFGDEGISFRDDESTRRYIDTAIARNIQHSLACYKSGSHFRHLINLYEANEFTNAVNRIIEDMNHRFLASVITKDFKSHDFGSASQIKRKRAALKGEVNSIDRIDSTNAVSKLMDILEIKNKEHQSVEITPDHITEIKEYLKILDLIIDCPTENIGNISTVENILFTQPGMRYCQAQVLVYSIMKDNNFRLLPISERDELCNIILEDVRGRMLEDIVLIETIKTLPRWKRAFKLLFNIGEFDMVIADEKNRTCEIYEIKHTENINEAQYKNLTDPQKCDQTEHDYGKITKKIVLYRGVEQKVNEIEYVNVIRYLEGLGK